MYDYVTSFGDSELQTTADCFAFELLPPFTGLTVTKILNFDSAGVVTTCEAVLDTLINVVANPEVGLDASAGICQESSTSVVCSILNSVPEAVYTHTWFVNDAGVLSGVTPGAATSVTNTLHSCQIAVWPAFYGIINCGFKLLE